MIVKTKQSVMKTANFASGSDWSSARMLVQSDGVGFSLNDTEVAAGTEMELEYQNHIEACYCVSGMGEIVDIATGETHSIAPGTLYCLNNNDRHILRASPTEPLRFICVFSPALAGNEVHDAEGSYGPPTEVQEI